MLEFCDIRDKALVLLFASTGMRIGAVPDLRLEHLQKTYDQKTTAKLYQITVYKGFKEEYICFCTPECRNAIDNYLKYREHCGEILTPESPLFREQFDITDLEKIRKKAKTIVSNTITKQLGKKLHLAGIIQIEQLKEGEDPTKKKKAVMRTHGFRKFVNTMMINCRMDSSIRNKLLGHSIGLDKSYWKPQVNDLLQEYLKVVDVLTINEENRLRRKVEMLTQETDQIKELQRQIVEINQKIGRENPYDLTDQIEEFKRRNNDDEEIEETRNTLAREKLQNELIQKGVPLEEILKRTLPRLQKQQEESSSASD